MALSSTRMEYRIALSHVDRGVDVTETVILARHPSETAEHLTLRVLAYCLLHEEGLGFGGGLSDPDSADLLAHDLTGRLKTWVECGAASLEKLKKVVQKNSGAAVHAVFSGPKKRKELLDELDDAGRAIKGLDTVTLWTIDPALVAALSVSEERRHKWSVTVVGDHLYVDADGESSDGAVERYHHLPPPH